jgi:hypothetical protein
MVPNCVNKIIFSKTKKNNTLKKYPILSVIILAIVFCTGCTRTNNYIKPELHTIQKTDKYIMVILVHGTIFPVPNAGVFFSSLHQFLSSGRKLNKSWYQLYLDQLQDKSIYKYQPSGPEGLHLITEQLSACLASAILQKFFSDQFSKCAVYTFCWNGKLSNKERVKAGCKLYLELFEEIKKLNKNYKNLEVYLMCHSHGGNVGLNLVHAEQKFKKNLSIDRLILFGIPVQSETAGHLKSQIFKRVYNFYSRGDNVQKIDILSTDDNWSQRTFETQDNLTQVDLSCDNLKPGHNELWLFGGKDNWLYRQYKLSISPFPLFVFTPVILQTLDKNFTESHDLKLNIKRDKKTKKLLFLFSDNKNKQEISVDTTILDKYKKIILSF